MNNFSESKLENQWMILLQEMPEALSTQLMLVKLLVMTVSEKDPR